MLHDLVIVIRIHLEAVDLPRAGESFGFFEYLGCKPPAADRSVQRKAVNDHVGLDAEPFAIQSVIGGFSLKVDADIAGYIMIQDTEIAPAFPDILFNSCLVRITILPLIHTISFQEGFCLVNKFHDFPQVFRGGCSKFHQ